LQVLGFVSEFNKNAAKSHPRPQNGNSYSRMSRAFMWRAFGFSSLFLVACSQDREALHQYLSRDFPELTRGVGDAVSAFNRTMRSKKNDQQRASVLQVEVLPPYQSAINRLREYEGKAAFIHQHHQRYLAIADRQMAAFKRVHQGLRRGRPVGQDLRDLESIHADMQGWTRAIAYDADRFSLRLINPRGGDE
jgi:hypothetical protein